MRNIALLIESFNTLPRWTVFVRIPGAVAVGVLLIWTGFFSGAAGDFALGIGLIGVGCLLGVTTMLGGGILTANFWRKLERVRRTVSEQGARH